ncbi:histidine phosphatase superfamily [Triangularia setosa]|uniref:Histidine phosphatase superfamily n=1 Tax=Triangularia setosa TaxID=2587417 RepID=A0AAN6VXG9_9PEZI|nr:histidine phosphatase superfamily [Podospora setosa]
MLGQQPSRGSKVQLASLIKFVSQNLKNVTAIILICHAEALHSVYQEHKGAHDPGLTSEGVAQCLKLREHLKTRLSGRKVERIIVSPMRRTMETALYTLDWLVQDGGVPTEASALWQAIYNKPCDTGRAIEGIKLDKTFDCVDSSKIDSIWPDKTSPRAALYHCFPHSIIQRGQKALRDLDKSDEGIVIIVSHNGFMRMGLIGQWTGNADYLVHSIVQGEQYGSLKLIEQEGMEVGAMWRSVVLKTDLGVLPEEVSNI